MSQPPNDASIVRSGTGWTVQVDGTDQSFVDLDDPRHLGFDYLERIATVIDLLGTPGERMRFVHVGGAGMSLARFVAASRPTSPQIVLEPATDLTALVRAELPLPRRSGIKVRPQDGRTGLSQMPDDHADVIVLDAFDGGRVPGEVATVEFFTEVARVLAPQGLMIANLGDRAPFTWTARFLAGLRQVLPLVMLGGEAATLKGRRHGNVLAMSASASENLPVEDVQRAMAGTTFPYSVLPPSEVRVRFSGGAPFTDDDHEPSPGPGAGGAARFG